VIPARVTNERFGRRVLLRTSAPESRQNEIIILTGRFNPIPSCLRFAFILAAVHVDDCKRELNTWREQKLPGLYFLNRHTINHTA